MLLDTCAAIWLSRGELPGSAVTLLDNAEQSGAGVLLSPVTAWEVATLVSKGRLALAVPPALWFASLLEEGLTVSRTPWSVLIDSASLPGGGLRDPADRILAATAREFGYQLMTRDKPLLSYAKGGWMRGVRC